MADDTHVSILKQGATTWNRWRRDNPDVACDFSGADFANLDLARTNLSTANLTNASMSHANLCRSNLRQARMNTADLSLASLRWADLTGADLRRARLRAADLRHADLRGAKVENADLSQADVTMANLRGLDLRTTELTAASFGGANLTGALLAGARLPNANFGGANLKGVDLRGAYLEGAMFGGANLKGTRLNRAYLRSANLSGGTSLVNADLTDADLRGSNLERAILVKTVLRRAILTDCSVFGIAAWDVDLHGAAQHNLVITERGEPMITADNLEVAQFLYLLSNNRKLRDIIKTVTSKVVLILGRFSTDRKAVLEVIRDALRRSGYLPVVFDFEAAPSRNLSETVSTLAHIARFVVADITDARSVPQELQVIVPNLPSVPVKPLLAVAADEYALFGHFSRYPWVLKTHRYSSTEGLRIDFDREIIAEAEAKAGALQDQTRRPD